MKIDNCKIALVFERYPEFGGAGVVNDCLVSIFPNADIYALFGKEKGSLVNKKRIHYSFLSKIPFITKIYTFLLPVWPVAIESFDLSKYNLVISSSHAVAKGCITSHDCIHISYVHTPIRYIWDLKDIYSKYGLLKAPFLSYLRIWDTYSSKRPDYLISNSEFVAKRCKRYWGRSVDRVIYPPVTMYSEKIIPYSQREDYFVSGAPFAENKGGDFLIECAKKLGFNLKIIGKSRGENRLKRKAKGCKNIVFLGRVCEKNKWEILSKANGFLCTGVEDFGIFPVESMSCGTPVLALRSGGYLESVKENINGMFYNENILDTFKKQFIKFLEYDWDSNTISGSVSMFNSVRFKKEVEEYVRNSI